MTEYKSIKFKFNLPYVVKFRYDKPYEKKGGEYGDFMIYGVEYEGEDCTFIASDGLHEQLSKYKKGDMVEIIKIDDDNKKSHFEVEQLSEKDIKSTDSPGADKPSYDKDWDKINADKDYLISLTVALKMAVASMPTKATLTDKDYEEIEIRMVKINAIRTKYLGVTIQNPVHNEEKADKKLPKLVQVQWDKFDAYLEENKATISADDYKVTRSWLDNLSDEVTNLKLLANFNKFKEKVEGKEYESYHEELITECSKLVPKTEREGVIALLDQIVFNWHNIGQTKLIQTSENECLNLLEEFENIHKKETLDEMLEKDYPPPKK